MYNFTRIQFKKILNTQLPYRKIMVASAATVTATATTYICIVGIEMGLFINYYDMEKYDSIIEHMSMDDFLQDYYDSDDDKKFMKNLILQSAQVQYLTGNQF
jgi:hypothetical protein